MYQASVILSSHHGTFIISLLKVISVTNFELYWFNQETFY